MREVIADCTARLVANRVAHKLRQGEIDDIVRPHRGDRRCRLGTSRSRDAIPAMSERWPRPARPGRAARRRDRGRRRDPRRGAASAATRRSTSSRCAGTARPRPRSSACRRIASPRAPEEIDVEVRVGLDVAIAERRAAGAGRGVRRPERRDDRGPVGHDPRAAGAPRRCLRARRSRRVSLLGRDVLRAGARGRRRGGRGGHTARARRRGEPGDPRGLRAVRRATRST